MSREDIIELLCYYAYTVKEWEQDEEIQANKNLSSFEAPSIWFTGMKYDCETGARIAELRIAPSWAMSLSDTPLSLDLETLESELCVFDKYEI